MPRSLSVAPCQFAARPECGADYPQARDGQPAEIGDARQFLRLLRVAAMEGGETKRRHENRNDARQAVPQPPCRRQRRSAASSQPWTSKRRSSSSNTGSDDHHGDDDQQDGQTAVALFQHPHQRVFRAQRRAQRGTVPIFVSTKMGLSPSGCSRRPLCGWHLHDKCRQNEIDGHQHEHVGSPPGHRPAQLVRKRRLPTVPPHDDAVVDAAGPRRQSAGTA